MAVLGGGYPTTPSSAAERDGLSRSPSRRSSATSSRRPAPPRRWRSTPGSVDDRLRALSGQVQQRSTGPGTLDQLRRREHGRGTRLCSTWDAGARVQGSRNWDSGRAILTYKPFGGRRPPRHPVPLAGGAGDAGRDRARRAQSTALNPPDRHDAFGAQRLRFLRGDPSQESRAAPARPALRRSSATATSRRSATSSTRRRTTSARRTSATTTTSRRRPTAPSSPPTARALR